MRRKEDAIQRAVIKHLRARCVPGVFWMHVPNGGQRNSVEAAIFKGLGVIAGVPDLIFIKQGKVYAMELKAEGGRLTETQSLTHEAMRQAGAKVIVAEGLDEAIRVIEHWDMVRGTSEPVFIDRMKRAAR